MSYLLDTNSYVQAKNHHYRMGFCPGFWHWLDSAYETGSIASISFVYKELVDYGDDLSKWAKERDFQFLQVDDRETQLAFKNIAEHVMELSLPKLEEKTKFLSGADPWLIAKAMTTGFTIVTHESAVPDNSKKIKIPNICNDFGVSYINTFDLLDGLNVSLVLASRKESPRVSI